MTDRSARNIIDYSSEKKNDYRQNSNNFKEKSAKREYREDRPSTDRTTENMRTPQKISELKRHEAIISNDIGYK